MQLQQYMPLDCFGLAVLHLILQLIIVNCVICIDLMSGDEFQQSSHTVFARLRYSDGQKTSL